MVELVERFSELRPNSNVPKTKPEPKEGDYVVVSIVGLNFWSRAYT